MTLKKTLSFMLLALLLTSGCSGEGNSASDSLSTPSFSSQKISLNEAAGLPTDSNVLKALSLCYEPESKRVFAVGTLTMDLAVLDEDLNFIEYQKTGLAVDDYDPKTLACDGGLVAVSTEDEVWLFDAVNKEDLGQLELGMKGGIESVSMLQNGELLAVASSKNELVFFDLNSLAEVKRLKKTRSIYAVDDDRLIIAEIDNEKKALKMEIYDVDSFKPLDTAEWKMTSGVKQMVYSAPEDLFYFLDNRGSLYQMGLSASSQPVKLSEETFDDVVDILPRGDELILLSDNGFDTETDGNFFGGLYTVDLKKGSVQTAVFPFQHHFAVINPEKNTLYLMNNDGNSVSELDLSDKSLITTALLGTSAEQGVWTNTSNLVVSSRLGGSGLYAYNQDLEFVKNLEPDAWPVSTIYDASRDLILSYDFLASSISVFDGTTLEQKDTFDLGVPDGATDILGIMTYDETHAMAYAAIPEQGTVAIYDIGNEERWGKIQIPNFNLKEVSTSQGPGKLLVAIESARQRLFVLDSPKQLLYYYDLSSGSAELKGSMDVADQMEDFAHFPLGMKMDEAGNTLWLGAYPLDLDTLEFGSKNAYGSNFVAYDAVKQFRMFSGFENEEEKLYVQNEQGELIQTLSLGEREYIASSFSYNAEAMTLAVFHMVSSTVEIVPLELE